MRRGLILMLVVAIAVAAAVGLRPAGSKADPAAPVRIAAVGDIACKNAPGNNRSVCQYDDVARTIGRGGYDRFLVLGDIQYEYGLYQDFLDNYDRYFGPLMPISEPAPGNHEYGRSDVAEGYFRYFGARAQGGYYSFDLGGWHIVSLNSAVCPAAVGCGPGDPQYEWLRADLAADTHACTLAYWHHPRFDWLKYQKANWAEDYEFLRTKPFWDLLYADGGDVVLSGHNHNYSRWLPMDTAGGFDPGRGIVQFISGAGGRNLNAFGGPQTRPSTFATGQSAAFGFLELTLRPGAYDYRFVPADGQPTGFIDQGTGVCH
ncbi:MAG TPA: metallophosphoesterase [Gaiellales bacterium]|nr:metallophosphoesterase [Gaiellales bacterium]